MIGWLAKKSISFDALRQLPGEAAGKTETAGAGAVAAKHAGEQAGFQHKNCAIWNDIQRALEGGGK